MGLDIGHSTPTLRTAPDEVLDYLTVEELADDPEYLDRHHFFIAETDDFEGGTQKVIFLKELGYQRKGMNRQFYTDFICDKPYLEFASVQRAYSYLEGDHINTLEDLQRNFRENFLDNFVEGESIFRASW